MGLFDYFKERRKRESAMPDGMSVGDAPVETQPALQTQTEFPAQPQQMPAAPQQPPSGDGTVVVGGNDLMTALMGLQALMGQHEVNLRSQPMEVREAVASDLQARGIQAQVGGALQITDPQQVKDTIEVLKQHGLLPPTVQVV